MALLSAGPGSLDKLVALGVAIKEINQHQQHCGLLYKLDTALPRMLHLAWHVDLRDEPAPNDYFWAEVSLDETNRRVIAAAVSLIGNKKASIPYGLDPGGSSFDASGEFIPPPSARASLALRS
jgi:hypothetical protein